MFVGKVEFAVLITEFELRRFGETQGFLEGVELIEIFEEQRALIVVAFVNGAVSTVFPKIKGMLTMRAPEFCVQQMAGMDRE